MNWRQRYSRWSAPAAKHVNHMSEVILQPPEWSQGRPAEEPLSRAQPKLLVHSVTYKRNGYSFQTLNNRIV